ncbi:MAG: hypothetical protein WC436_03025 [Candidatus Babeliales bacterium]
MKKNFILFICFQIILGFISLLSMPLPPAPAGGMPTSPSQPQTQPAAPAPVVAQPTPTSTPATAAAKAMAVGPAVQKPLDWQTTGIKNAEKESTGFVLSEQTKKEREDAKKSLDNVSKDFDQINNKRDGFYNKFREIDGKLDTLLLQANIFVGKQLQKVEEKEKEKGFESYKKELNNIKEKAGSIDKSKTEFLDYLKKFDDNMNEAMDNFLGAKKLNMQILISDNQSAADQNIKDIKDKLSKIEKIKTEINSNLNSKMESAISNIQKTMQETEQNLKKVEEKGKELGLPVPVMPAEIIQPKAKDTKVEKVKQVKEEGSSSLYNFSVGAVASATLFIKKMGKWFIGATGNFVHAVKNKIGMIESTQSKEKIETEKTKKENTENKIQSVQPAAMMVPDSKTQTK